ncbi:MAG TPA: fibronectin type III domain-containing protein [Mycobacteriales bacterium]|nr:fibronectin type III domain-containing protein [Mycobacteriales bacterium]
MRRGVGVLVTLGLLVGGVAVGSPSAAAETAVPDGAFTCSTAAAPADSALTSVAVTPAVVASGAGPVDVVFAIAEDVPQPPRVTLATRDGQVAFTQDAVPDPAGWRSQLTLPADAPPAELGVSIAWADERASTCALQARSLPSVVALHPVAPAPPTQLSVGPGDGQAGLVWARAADGGAPLSGYRVVAQPGGLTYDVHDPQATQAVLRGLVNGTTYRFQVTAISAAGASPVATSPPVIPRRLLALGSVHKPATVVVYGGRSTASAVVRTKTGTAVPGVPVELRARRVGTTAWKTVARATSSSTGLVTLRAVLPVSSQLQLAHAIDGNVLPTASVGTVAVVSRVSSVPWDTTPGAAYAQTVSGAVAPSGPVGSRVTLQRYVSGGWHSIANGSLISSTGYRIKWTPAHAGGYRLRVLRPAVSGVGAGVSPPFTVTAADTRISVAREILADQGTTLATGHESGVVDRADARHELLDTAAGRAARRSSYQNAPGGSVMLDLRVLRLIRHIGQLASIGVSEVAGGSHAPASLHYRGTAVDISVVNGARVRPGSGYMVVVRACQAAGASEIFYPAHDPYGGHQNHVHCGFE